ncbi:retron system putative HNH endonuclease [Vibrio aestuarianus]|uniref:TIGR02646 family protein n=1 Tax=Vibrio aestuarianus TaxID=28171 RepID=A0A9X4FCF2_9VIBR|nr:retron system putative HNH endonuclease [Vibrio aestuarianus]EGR3178661.1 TIGR02646 family protein [Vibrio parahaemolyticus]EIE1219722.1 TIGR02646 family protein [Vibrio parahaemolyticus]EIE1257645.1 TIGR02646 family protein [Vibrio parahaemolyticus]EIE1335548.1 TIGR02646 family protein [Vibrio parahaemolyticus]EJC6880999.1 TIGR02646 family protein [Vibrio parahaemolyticus]
MRPVHRGDVPEDNEGNPKEYTEYTNARKDLISRIGEYCSYCEMELDTSLAIEHIRPKAHHSHLELKWGNFLLACTNCNSTKGDKDPNPNDILWPHLDNTFRAFEYTTEGRVKPAPGLSATLKRKAEDTIALMGLAAAPDTQKASDRRWLNRQEAWQDAILSKADLAEADLPAMRRQIVRTAKAKGYWSIWMTVFHDDPDMLRRFIDVDNFPGTAQDCFDIDGLPILRTNGKL